MNDGFAADSADNDTTIENLAAINAQLADLGIRAMDLTTINEMVNFIEDSIMDDELIEALNTLLDDAE